MIRYHTRWGLLCQIVIAFSLVFQACKQDKNNIHDLSAYYFNNGQLPDSGLTYIYQNVRDSLGSPERWHFQLSGPNLVLSTNFDESGQAIQRQYDRIVENGVLTDSLVLFSTDSAGNKQRVPVKVISPNRFPFDAIDTSRVWLTHLEWYQPGDSLHIVLQRRRKFDDFIEYKLDGKVIPAIRFTTEDTFETERDGWTSSTWKGEEVYAKGKGMVYYKREISKEMVLEYALEK